MFIKAGMTSASLTNPPSAPEHARLMRLGYGIALEHPIRPQIRAVLEAVYVEMGEQETGYPGIGRSALPYVSVPVLLQYRAGNRKGITPKLFGGYALSFRTSSVLDTEPLTGANPAKAVDHGVMIGVGGEMKLGKQTVTLDVRTYTGLTRVRENQKRKHRGVWVMAGMKIF